MNSLKTAVCVAQYDKIILILYSMNVDLNNLISLSRKEEKSRQIIN